MQSNFYKIFFVCLLFSILNTLNAYSCAKKRLEKSGCTKTYTQKKTNTSCCEQVKKTCKKDKTKSSCDCFCYSFNLFFSIPTEFPATQIFNKKKNENSFSNVHILLAGYHSVWLPPKIV